MKKPGPWWACLAGGFTAVYVVITVFSYLRWDVLAQVCWTVITLGMATITVSWAQQYRRDVVSYREHLQDRAID